MTCRTHLARILSLPLQVEERRKRATLITAYEEKIFVFSSKIFGFMLDENLLLKKSRASRLPDARILALNKTALLIISADKIHLLFTNSFLDPVYFHSLLCCEDSTNKNKLNK